MSFFWSKNLALFCRRFAPLAARFRLTPESTLVEALAAVAAVANDAESKETTLPFSLTTARNGSPSARDSDGRYLHSQYNPEREAEQACRAVHTEGTRAVAFLGFGLGYAPNAYARLFPDDALVLVEPDPRYLFAALAATDWSTALSAPNVCIALQADADDVTALLEQAVGASGAGTSALDHCAFLAPTAHTAHAADYFAAVIDAVRHARQKANINNATLERFSRLWLRNSCRNLRVAAACAGVARYAGRLPSALPVLLLAAGPTLAEVLPSLAELKKRALIICVDTALHASLRAGTEPDFVLLTDPQYHAYRHIAGLHAPSSVLVTESAAYPAAFRFDCREIILCSSLFPLGAYFERRLGAKGKLETGGSVATTAWDFARYIGARRIFVAGLDLGFPGTETHIRGSQFEEQLHTSSSRVRPAETGSVALLFGATMRRAARYDDGTLLTDDRMQLYAWWFERALAAHPEAATYALSPRSLAIAGVRLASVADLLAEPERLQERVQFLASPPANDSAAKVSFDAVLADFLTGLDSLYQLAQRGISLAESGIRNRTRADSCLRGLEAVDAQILRSEFKEVAALVFPTTRQLDAILAQTTYSNDKTVAAFQRSKVVYRELQSAINRYRSLLQKSH